MICSANDERFRWVDRAPISLTELKSILAKLTSKEAMKLSTSTSTNAQHRPKPLIKKQSRQVPAQSQLYGDAVINSFLVSSSSSAVHISRQGILNANLDAKRNQCCLDLDVPDAFVPPKRYTSSFRTLVHPTTTKQTQRLNYINDSVVIFKLSKEPESNNSSIVNSQVTSKPASLSPTASVKIPPAPSPIRLSPVLKIEGQTIPPPTILSGSSNQMTTSTTNHHQSHPSVFTYRSAAAGGNTVRQRAIADPPSNSLLITAERFKTTMTSTMRSTRQQSLPITTTTSYVPSQQIHRNLPQTNRSRVLLDKLKTSQDNYEYADPYTNCPPELLNKLSHLTKLQLETIEWEKRKRFTKKKPASNAFLQGKDSP
ncbi:unnamed protein product [Adineta ricciae]|uniref:Uncharacterized protein n=1 Tax=Adineta ricciae TaxID=249248 RepID=A0A814PAP0_ADIRI|nr:unnamed protein product [Adineta ricciae]